MYSAGSDSPPHQDKVQVPHPRASKTVKMSSTITIPTSVTCMENVKIDSLEKKLLLYVCFKLTFNITTDLFQTISFLSHFIQNFIYPQSLAGVVFFTNNQFPVH